MTEDEAKIGVIAALKKYGGHDLPCYYCGERCDGLAGNPAKWPLGFPHKEEPGVVKYHHMGCVMDRLDAFELLQAAGRTPGSGVVHEGDITTRLRAEMEIQDGYANMVSNLRKPRTDNNHGRLAQLLEDAAGHIAGLQAKADELQAKIDFMEDEAWNA